MYEISAIQDPRYTMFHLTAHNFPLTNSLPTPPDNMTLFTFHSAHILPLFNRPVRYSYQQPIHKKISFRSNMVSKVFLCLHVCILSPFQHLFLMISCIFSGQIPFQILSDTGLGSSRVSHQAGKAIKSTQLFGKPLVKPVLTLGIPSPWHIVHGL